jgi:signal transduction histidine kinase
MACVKVSDSGVGISAEQIQDIFEPFQQASSGVERLHKGVGLGLTIANRHVKLLNGYIEVESDKDQGSTFRIFIPEFTDSQPA